MSQSHTGPLATYNSLTDKHLMGYFNNTRIRRHLQRAGLVTRNGRIVSEKEYRLNIVRKDHQKYVRESLAQAIFHKVLDMERHHQLEIKKRLEDFARRERVQRIKVERARRSDEDIIPFLSPRPPVFPRNSHHSVSRPDVEHSDSSTSPSSPRPSTAPGKLQRPVRLLPLQSNGAAATVITTPSSPYLRHKEQHPDVTKDTNSKSLHGPHQDLIKNWHTLDFPTGMSPYRLPVINNYVTPIPPAPRKREKNGCLRGRRLRPTTAPNGPANLPAKEIAKSHRAVTHSNVLVTMVYRGKHLHLSYDQAEARDEIKVHQQHCGGENLCVYKGKLLEAEKFQFVSRRHSGFPFSLTFFLNGIQVNRLSSCCEYKHRKGSRLGGKLAYFAFLDVDGASPCYRCIITMGLDKKPTPPPKRMKEEVVKEMEKEKQEPTKDKEKLTVVNASGETSQEEAMTAESSIEEERVNEEERMHEGEGGSSLTRSQDRSSKEEYDDDFEDGEKTNEEVEQKGQRKSPADLQERWSSDDEQQSENSDVQDERSVSEKEHTDSSDSESEEEMSRSQGSSRSSSYSPRSSEMSDVERLEGEKTDDEEQEKLILSEDEGEPTTAKNLGAAPGESEQESCEVKPVNNNGRADKKVTGAEALLEGEVDSEKQTTRSSGGEDQSPQTAGRGPEEKVGMDEEIEADKESNANPENSNKEGAETDEESLVTVGIYDRHSKDVALRGSEVSVCTAELSVSGRSVGTLSLDVTGKCKSIQQKIADAIKEDRSCNSEPEPSDSSTEEEDMASGDNTETASVQRLENDIPSARVVSIGITQSVGMTPESLIGLLNRNPGEPVTTLDVKALTVECRIPEVEVRNSGGGAVQFGGIEGTAITPIREVPEENVICEGPLSLPRSAEEAGFGNGEIPWDWSMPKAQETEEGRGRFCEEKGKKIKGKKVWERDESQTRGAGVGEDSRLGDRVLPAHKHRGATCAEPDLAESERDRQAAREVKSQCALENREQSVSAVNIQSKAHQLSLGVPAVEERERVIYEETERVRSPILMLSPIHNVRGRRMVGPSVKKEGKPELIKDVQEEELSRPIHYSNDVASRNEGIKEVTSSIANMGFKLEKLNSGMPRNLLIPEQGAREQETTVPGNTAIPRTPWKYVPDVESEHLKGVESEGQKKDMNMKALEWTDPDIGNGQKAKDKEFPEESVSKNLEEECEPISERCKDPEEDSDIGILLLDTLRANTEPERNGSEKNGSVGNILEILDGEKDLRMGFLPIGIDQEVNRSDPAMAASNRELFPSEANGKVNTENALEEMLQEKGIGGEDEVKEVAVSMSNSKCSSVGMGGSDGDVIQVESLLVESGVRVTDADLDGLSKTPSGETVVSPDAGPGASSEVQMEEPTELNSERKEDLAAPASEAEIHKVRIVEASSGGNVGEVDLRWLTSENEQSEETQSKRAVQRLVRVQGDFVNCSESLSLVTEEKGQGASGLQKGGGLGIEEDLETLANDTEMWPLVGEEKCLKFQGERSDSRDMIGWPQLVKGEQATTESQATIGRAGQKTHKQRSENHWECMTPETKAGSSAKQGLGDLKTREPRAARQQVEKPKAREVVNQTEAEHAVTDSRVAEIGARTTLGRVDESSVRQRLLAMGQNQFREPEGMQDRETVSETYDQETESETQDKEIMSEMQGKKMISKTQDQELAPEIQDRKLVSGKQDRKTVPETPDQETLSETQDNETVSIKPETEKMSEIFEQTTASEIRAQKAGSGMQDIETVSETQDQVTMLETQNKQTVPETQDQDTVSEINIQGTTSKTQDLETVSETHDQSTALETLFWETVSATEDIEPLSKIVQETLSKSHGKGTVPETQDQETVTETWDEKTGTETQDQDTVSETQEQETVSETQEQETVTETQSQETVTETQDQDTVSETQEQETGSETQDQETVTETQNQEAVTETLHHDTVSETQEQETGPETQEQETGPETQEQETVSETQDQETVFETQDQVTMSEKQGKETLCEIQEQETMSETQDQEAVSETRDKKVVSEIQDQETMSAMQDRGTVSETQNQETVTETPDKDLASETQDQKLISGSHDMEALSEMQTQKTVSETQINEIVAETPNLETVLEKQKTTTLSDIHADETLSDIHADETLSDIHADETLSEPQSMETAAEIQDMETMSKTRGQETQTNKIMTKSRIKEIKSEAQSLKTVSKRQEKETLSETHGRESAEDAQTIKNISETQESETAPETQIMETVSEAQHKESGVKVQDKEIMSETQAQEIISEVQYQGSVTETQDEDTVSERHAKEIESETGVLETMIKIPDGENVIRLQDSEIVSEKQVREVLTEIQDIDPGLETHHLELVQETQATKGLGEIQPEYIRSETEKIESEREIHIKDLGLEKTEMEPEPVSEDRQIESETTVINILGETQDKEGVVDGDAMLETECREMVAEAQERESVLETDDRDTVVETEKERIIETQNVEAVGGTQDREAVIEIQDLEAVVEIQDGESMLETQDWDATQGMQDEDYVTATQDREAVVKTQESEIVLGRHDREAVIEIQDLETVVETQYREVLGETQDKDVMGETQDKYYMIETQDREITEETQDREIVVETQGLEDVVERKHREALLETEDKNSVVETQNRETVGDIQNTEIVVAVQDRNTVVETQDGGSVIEAQDKEAVIETRDREAVIETQGREPVIEMQDREVVMETQDGEAVIDTQDRETVIETQDGETVIETQDRETVIETQDGEAVIETQDGEAVIETQDRETVIETQDGEAVIETQDGEAVIETQDRETVIETHNREVVIETQDREVVIETQDGEAVIETLGKGAVIETQDREAVIETQGGETVIVTQDGGTVMETLDKGSVIESQDREPVDSTRNQRTAPDTENQETMKEPQRLEPVRGWHLGKRIGKAARGYSSSQIETNLPISTHRSVRHWRSLDRDTTFPKAWSFSNLPDWAMGRLESVNRMDSVLRAAGETPSRSASPSEREQTESFANQSRDTDLTNLLPEASATSDTPHLICVTPVTQHGDSTFSLLAQPETDGEQVPVRPGSYSLTCTPLQ